MAQRFLLETVRLAVWLLLLMVIFVPLERVLALHEQKIWRRSLWKDIALYFLNGLLPKALLVLPMALIASVLQRVVPASVHEVSAHLPLWARLSAALLVGEFGFYWGHRWTHQIPFLWRFHSVHHDAQEMDWLVNTHAHPLDVVFVRLCGFVPMYALGLAHPLESRALDPVPLLIMVIATLWGFFIHANLRLRWKWVQALIATPAFHHWHHTSDRGHWDKNFASMLPFLDRLFGTWYLPQHWPEHYGIEAEMPQEAAAELEGKQLTAEFS